MRQKALLLAIGLAATACERSGTEQASRAEPSSAAPPQVMLELPPSGTGKAKPIGPFYIARQSDVIATATIGPKLTFEGRPAVRLHLARVLYGRVASRSVSSSDELPSYGCFPPEKPTLASSLFSPGAKVIVYLASKPAKGFALRSIERLPASGPNPELLRYAEARRLRESPKASSADYRRLLANETWKYGSGALAALGGDARAVPVLLEHLEACGDAKPLPGAAVFGRVSTILQLMPSEELHRGIRASAPLRRERTPGPARHRHRRRPRRRLAERGRARARPAEGLCAEALRQSARRRPPLPACSPPLHGRVRSERSPAARPRAAQDRQCAQRPSHGRHRSSRSANGGRHGRSLVVAHACPAPDDRAELARFPPRSQTGRRPGPPLRNHRASRPDEDVDGARQPIAARCPTKAQAPGRVLQRDRRLKRGVASRRVVGQPSQEQASASFCRAS